MLKKRIIPCLDIKDGRTVKGVNFENIKDAGNPIELARKYVEHGADELVFLDISATVDKREMLIGLVKQISKEINIPFTVGGGVRSVNDVKRLLNAGADKVSLNSSVVKRPELISEIANQCGSQSVVIAVDTKFMNGQWKVFTHGGRVETHLDTLEWVKKIKEYGGGEILLTSMNNDGMKTGFAIDIIKQVTDVIDIPVIASGGAGSLEDFKHVFQATKATGALAASIFHYGEICIPELKQYLKTENLNVRC